MNLKHRFDGKSIFLTTTIFLFAVMARAQAPNPDLTKGGPFGPKPSGTPEQQIVNKAHLGKTEDEAKPKILNCGEQYEVDITLTQDAKSCEGFNFKKLYEQAKEMADHGIEQIKCPAEEDCVGPHRWYGYWRWGCVDATHAIVEVQEITTCVKPGTMVSIGQGDGSKQSKTKPVSLGGPPPKDPVESGEFITEKSMGALDGWNLDCGTKFLASYTYEVTTPVAAALEALTKGDASLVAITNIKNFKPFYDQAEAKAKAYHAQFKCKPSGSAKCTLLPFKVLSGDIQANGGAGTVTIILYFEVECKKS